MSKKILSFAIIICMVFNPCMQGMCGMYGYLSPPGINAIDLSILEPRQTTVSKEILKKRRDKAVFEGSTLIGFMRDDQGKIQFIYSDSPIIQSVRVSGNIHAQANELETFIVPLKIDDQYAFDKSAINSTENWYFLPDSLRSVYENGSILVTDPKAKSRYSLLMFSFTGGAIDRQGRTGVLLEDSLPVVVDVDGTEFLVEIKGTGIPSGGFIKAGERIAGGLRKSFADREIKSLDSRKNSNAYKNKETIRCAANIQFNDKQSCIIRLTPGNMRTNYMGNKYLPDIDQQEYSKLIGKEIGSLFAEGKITHTHVENFIISENGKKVTITDYADIYDIADLPVREHEWSLSLDECIESTADFITELSGVLAKDRHHIEAVPKNILYAFFSGFAEGFGQEKGLLPKTIEALVSINHIHEFKLYLAYILGKEITNTLFYDIGDSLDVFNDYVKGRAAYPDKIVEYYRKINEKTGLPQEFHELFVESVHGALEYSESDEVLEGINMLAKDRETLREKLQELDYDLKRVIAAAKHDSFLKKFIVNFNNELEEGNSLSYQYLHLNEYLEKQIIWLKAVLFRLDNERDYYYQEYYDEVRFNLMLAEKKYDIVKQLYEFHAGWYPSDDKKFTSITETVENKDFIMSLWLLPYFMRIRQKDFSWINHIAENHPEMINLGLSMDTYENQELLPVEIQQVVSNVLKSQ